MKRKTSSYYPLFLDINGKKCVVVGGGEVALRKVEAFLNLEAVVKVVSPNLCSGLNALSEKRKIFVLKRRYEPGDLAGAILVVAATDDSAINVEVAKEARKSGILVNVVDDASHSDFIVPSSFQRGDITIAVSTAGRSPALARKLRSRLEKEFGEEYASLTVLIDEVRTEVRQQGVTISGDDWQEALDLDLLIDLIKKGDVRKARTVLLDNLKSKVK